MCAHTFFFLTSWRLKNKLSSSFTNKVKAALNKSELNLLWTALSPVRLLLEGVGEDVSSLSKPA
jgi:hypothetical protein